MSTKAEKKAAKAAAHKKRVKKEAHEKRIRDAQKAAAKRKNAKRVEKQQQAAKLERIRKKKENMKEFNREQQRLQAAKAKRIRENNKKMEMAKVLKAQKKKENIKKANIARNAAAQRRKEVAEAKALRAPELLAASKEAQAGAIIRHQREVEITFDITTMEEQIREMLSQHGEIESLKKNIRGGLDVRFANREAAESLLKKKSNTSISASLTFPVTPVVIKQHCLYYMPQGYVIDQEVLNATAEYFSSISVVQQVKKLRNAVLVVFEDEETRDQMVKQSEKTNWKILDHLIGPCHGGLPPAINKKRRKPQNQQKKKKKKKKKEKQPKCQWSSPLA